MHAGVASHAQVPAVVQHWPTACVTAYSCVITVCQHEVNHSIYLRFDAVKCTMPTTK